jgi:hypothetical protein
MRVCWWAILLVVAAVGCSVPLTPLTPEQASALMEAQRTADRVTTAYGVSPVHVYASAGLPQKAGGGYAYRQDWIVIRPDLLTGDESPVVLSHELGHATLRHQWVEQPQEPRVSVPQMEAAANHRGVEIMARFMGFSQRQALERYTAFLIRQHRMQKARLSLIAAGHRPACTELRELWESFGQAAPRCDK